MAALPSGLVPGGGQALTDLSIAKSGLGMSYGNSRAANNVTPQTDWRVRITLPPQSYFAFRNVAQKNGGFNMPLTTKTAYYDGVIFPYTPSITITHNARYSEAALTHSNYKSYFYEGSDIGPISISGVFTCQNQSEAIYVMSCIQFLRACTKMRFGGGDLLTTGLSTSFTGAGAPPTLVRLMGYGDNYLPGPSCVVTSVSHQMPDDVDYIPYEYNAWKGWMPTHSTITVNLQPVVSRRTQSNFNLDAYAAGAYVNSYPGTTNAAVAGIPIPGIETALDATGVTKPSGLL
jgi:hypothetical protein